MIPLALLGPHLDGAPYVVVAHGAEITGYGRVPVSRPFARRVLRGAGGIVAAGTYPAREAVRAAGAPLPGVVIPPGVDVERFRPVDDETRKLTRARFGLDPDRPLVLGLSRLVPRKGFDVVIDACEPLTDVQLAIGGAGRDGARLARRGRGPRAVPRPRPRRRSACALRVGGRVRDVLSRTMGWARSRRLRHRVPRGRRVRRPLGRRAQRGFPRSRRGSPESFIC